MNALVQILSLACRLFVAGVFLLASYDKVWDPAAFARAVSHYDILPLWAVNPGSVLLAWLELMVGLMLLVGVWLRTAALWSTGLLVFFIGLMIWAGLTGAGYDCGCFPGSGDGHAAGYDTAIRDLWFLLPSLWLVWRPGRWLALRP